LSLAIAAQFAGENATLKHINSVLEAQIRCELATSDTELCAKTLHTETLAQQRAVLRR